MKLINQFFIFLFFLTSLLSFSQNSINNYKYVAVPENYSFLKSKDQYQLNSLTAFLFEKYNFTVLNSLGNYPTDLANNKCLLLNSDIIRIKGVFKTKLQFFMINENSYCKFKKICSGLKSIVIISSFLFVFINDFSTASFSSIISSISRSSIFSLQFFNGFFTCILFRCLFYSMSS